MRSDLNAVKGIADAETDMEDNTCTFIYSSELEIKSILKGLAKENDKMADFEILKQD